MAVGNCSTRDANSSLSRALSGSTAGDPGKANGRRPLNATGSSSSASGLPAASASRRRRMSGPRIGNRARTRRSPSSKSSGSSWHRGRLQPSNKLPDSVRSAASKPTWLPASRRATNPNTSALARSIQNTSSSRISSGCFSPARVTRSSAAPDTTNRSGGGPSPSPNATDRASRYQGRSSSIPSSSGSSNWWSAEKLISASNSAPAARTTVTPSEMARRAATSSSAVFPTPASPTSSSAPPPSTARSMNDPSTSISTSRPTRHSSSAGALGVI